MGGWVVSVQDRDSCEYNMNVWFELQLIRIHSPEASNSLSPNKACLLNLFTSDLSYFWIIRTSIRSVL